MRRFGKKSLSYRLHKPSERVVVTLDGRDHYLGAHGSEESKPHIVVDALGVILAVTVTSAAADDGTDAPRVLEKLTKGSFPRLTKLWADNEYRNHSLDAWISEHG